MDLKDKVAIVTGAGKTKEEFDGHLILQKNWD